MLLLTQSDIARRMGVSRQYIYQLKAKRRIPPATTITPSGVELWDHEHLLAKCSRYRKAMVNAGGKDGN
jgi:predicted transcriptional regulator